VYQGPDLYPDNLAAEIDALSAHLHTDLNIVVYQAGFASSQQAYDETYKNVFAALHEM
jgi:putative glutathione S-transferase